MASFFLVMVAMALSIKRPGSHAATPMRLAP
jgi:hypothetical protein